MTPPDGTVTLPASKVVATPDPVQAHQSGRLCAHPECATRLSRYNPDALCTAHGGWSDATVKRPGRKPAARPAAAAPAGTAAPAGERRSSGSLRPGRQDRGAGPSSVEILLPDDDGDAGEDRSAADRGDDAALVIAEIELQQPEDRMQMQPLLQRVGNLLSRSDLEVDLHDRGAVVRGALAEIMDCVQRIHELSARHGEDVQTSVRVIAPARSRPGTRP